LLLSRLIGTGADGEYNTEVSTWVKDQTMAAIRSILPDLLSEHGVLAMGEIQDATAQATLAKVNASLGAYGLAVTTFGELNVNLPEADARQLKQFAAAKAYSGIAGSFDSAVRGQAALEIAGGIADGNVGAQPGIVAGMMMGLPVAPTGSAVPAGSFGSAPAPAAAAAPAGPVVAAHFCGQCGTALATGNRFCSNCGAAVPGQP
jgi:membrane protease subunit (stomatin/prohibitin family)